jgi:hypothetical protein
LLYPTSFVGPCKKFGWIIDSQCCNYCHVPNVFSSTFQWSIVHDNICNMDVTCGPQQIHIIVHVSWRMVCGLLVVFWPLLQLIFQFIPEERKEKGVWVVIIFGLCIPQRNLYYIYTNKLVSHSQIYDEASTKIELKLIPTLV